MAGVGQIKTGLAVCAGLIVAGCGDSSDDEGGGISEPTARALSGIYQLTRFTRNETSCDAEGPPVVPAVTDGFFVMASTVVLGNRIVQLASCSGIEDCRSKSVKMQNLGTYAIQFSFTLSRELDPMHVAGFEASTGAQSSDGKTCTDREYSDHNLTVEAGGSVVLESRTKNLADRLPEDGFCVVRPAESKDEARDVPCSELRVLAGTKIAEL